MEKTVVLIDNGYLKKVQDYFKVRVNYEKFSDEICGCKENRFRTYVYDCPPYQNNPPTPEQVTSKSFFDSFKYNVTRLSHFEFRIGRLQIVRDDEGNIIKRKDGTPQIRQKGVDLALGIDATRLASKNIIQTIILVAGDSDFVPAIISAKQDGVIVKLYYSTISYVHDSLMEVCDDRIEITKELLLKCQR